MELPKNVRSIANLGDLAINELRDINFGNRLKSGDTTANNKYGLLNNRVSNVKIYYK